MGFQCMVIAKAVQAGDSFATHLTFTLALSSFHFSTLEEYYTGGLFLGPGNGISDGSAILIGINIIMGIFGNEWLLEFFIGDIRYADVFMYAVGITNFGVIMLCFKGIIAHSKKDIKYDPVTNTGDITGEKFVMKDFISQLFHFTLTISLLGGLVYIG